MAASRLPRHSSSRLLVETLENRRMLSGLPLGLMPVLHSLIDAIEAPAVVVVQQVDHTVLTITVTLTRTIENVTHDTPVQEVVPPVLGLVNPVTTTLTNTFNDATAPVRPISGVVRDVIDTVDQTVDDVQNQLPDVGSDLPVTPPTVPLPTTTVLPDVPRPATPTAPRETLQAEPPRVTDAGMQPRGTQVTSATTASAGSAAAPESEAPAGPMLNAEPTEEPAAALRGVLAAEEIMEIGPLEETPEALPDLEGADLAPGAGQLNLTPLDIALQQFVQGADQIVRDLAQSITPSSVLPWVAAAVIAGMGLEVRRRRKKAWRAVLAPVSLTTDSTWSWMPGMPGSLSDEDA